MLASFSVSTDYLPAIPIWRRLFFVHGGLPLFWAITPGYSVPLLYWLIQVHVHQHLQVDIQFDSACCKPRGFPRLFHTAMISSRSGQSHVLCVVQPNTALRCLPMSLFLPYMGLPNRYERAKACPILREYEQLLNSSCGLSNIRQSSSSFSLVKVCSLLAGQCQIASS